MFNAAKVLQKLLAVVKVFQNTRVHPSTHVYNLNHIPFVNNNNCQLIKFIYC